MLGQIATDDLSLSRYMQQLLAKADTPTSRASSATRGGRHS
jgi:hypothetical protein